MEHAKQKFKAQIGQGATVQRERTLGEPAQRANQILTELGASLNPVPGSLKYMGSAAVHIFWNETLEQVFFASQTEPLKALKCPEPLAQAAFKDLIGTAVESYGHRRPRLRSGF